jgi:peroxiredoxin (alkyl hydroperoxide reductase subunit C)
MVGVGQEFPQFKMNTCEVNDSLGSIDETDVDSQWTVMYFYPKDFTFICPTEIAAFDMLTNDAQVIGVSGDNEFCKKAWKESNERIKHIDHILAADSGMRLGYELGIVSETEGVHYRATYIIDPNNIVQHVSVNALDTGRNAEEIARTLSAIQAGGLTGCSWQPEDDFVA